MAGVSDAIVADFHVGSVVQHRDDQTIRNDLTVQEDLIVTGDITMGDDLVIPGDVTLTGTVNSGYVTLTQEVTFTETSGAGVWTGTMVLGTGSRIIDIGCDAQALWDSQTSASLIVGDGVDPDGFFTATDLKATDLLAGEINNIEHPGGKAGAYIVSEQRNLYQSATRSIIAVLTKVGTTGTLGRTRVYVTYAAPTAVAATKV